MPQTKKKKKKSTIDKSVLTAVEAVNDFFDVIKEHMVQRGTVVDVIKLAMMTKQHVLLHGIPGTAKSMLADKVFNNIDNGDSVFKIQLKKGMGEEHFFGGVNVKELTEGSGKVLYNLKGSLVAKRFAFIDEFFDGSGPLLRSLLEVINERTFSTGYQKAHSPLHTLIATTNFHVDTENMQAVLSRFLFHVDVKKVEGRTDRLKLYKTFLDLSKREVPNITYDTLKAITDAVPKVKIPDKILRLYDAILDEWQEESHTVYDRNSCINLRIVQATALLNKRFEVTIEDLDCLKYLLPCVGNREQETVFTAVMGKTISDQQIREVEEIKIEKLEKSFKGMRSSVDSAKGYKPSKLRDLLEKVNKVYRGLSSKDKTSIPQIDKIYDDFTRESLQARQKIELLLERA